MNKKIWTAMAMLLLGVVLAGCAGSARDNAAPTVATHWMETDGGTVYMAVESRRLHAIATPPPPGAVPEQAFDMVPDDAADWERVAGQQERHVIQQAHIEMESDAFDATVDALRLVAPAVEGYVESEMRTATRWPRFTVVLRVPASRFEEVLRHIEALADIRTQNQWADDVTDQFYDMAGSLATRRIEEERVLALIAQATDIHDLLVLESRLTQTRHAIASYLSQLNHMAGQITYSTITVVLTCTAMPAPAIVPTMGERIGGAFGESVDATVRAAQSLVVFLAGAVLPLGLLGLLGFVGFRLVRLVRRKVKSPV